MISDKEAWLEFFSTWSRRVVVVLFASMLAAG
jgi:hypothetical protein